MLVRMVDDSVSRLDVSSCLFLSAVMLKMCLLLQQRSFLHAFFVAVLCCGAIFVGLHAIFVLVFFLCFIFRILSLVLQTRFLRAVFEAIMGFVMVVVGVNALLGFEKIGPGLGREL